MSSTVLPPGVRHYPHNRFLLIDEQGTVWRLVPPRAIDEATKEAIAMRKSGATFRAIAQTLSFSCAAAAFKAIKASTRPSRILPATTWLDAKGYACVANDGDTLRVHHAVLETFVGPCPPGHEACHNNGVRSDNRLTNLRWDTHRANLLDRKQHGTDNSGERNGQAKLTADVVRRVRGAAAQGTTFRLIAEQFCVSRASVSMIVNRKRWEHVE